MAKSDSLINLRGTFGGLTFVKSRTYGDHVRAKRGTHKKAEVNSALKSESKLLLKANVPAKILKDAISPYLGNLANGTLWPRLVSVMNRQLKTHGKFDFGYLNPFEFNTDYPFERFLGHKPQITLKKKERLLHVSIVNGQHPVFKRARYVDGYRLTAIGIFPDMKKKSAEIGMTESSVIALKGALPFPISLQLNVPARATRWVICLKIEGCEGDKVCNSHVTEGMRIVAAGAI